MTRLELRSPEWVAWVVGGSLGAPPDPSADDSWQLGCLLIELLVERSPFRSNFFWPGRLMSSSRDMSDEEAYIETAKHVQAQHLTWVSLLRQVLLQASASPLDSQASDVLVSIGLSCPSLHDVSEARVVCTFDCPSILLLMLTRA